MRRRKKSLFDLERWRKSPWPVWGLFGTAAVLYIALMTQLMTASREDRGPRPSIFQHEDEPTPALRPPPDDESRDVSSLEMVPHFPAVAKKPTPPPAPPADPEPAPPPDSSGDDRPDWAKAAGGPPAAPDQPASPPAPTHRKLIATDLPSMKTSSFKTSAFLANPTTQTAPMDASAPQGPAGSIRKPKREPRDFRDLSGRFLEH